MEELRETRELARDRAPREGREFARGHTGEGSFQDARGRLPA